MITTSFNSGAGQIELNILSNHTSVATISQIGQLRYSFDQTPDTLSIDRVQALYTYINIDLLQYDDGGNDLWEVLISETNSATIQVTLDVVLPDGAFGFLFKIRKPDISLNERSGIVTLRLTPFTNFNTNMGTLFDSMYSGSVDSRNFRTSFTSESGVETSYRYKCVSPKDFIDYALTNVFGNGYDNIIKPSLVDLDSTFSNVTYDEFQSGKNQFVMVDVRTENPPDGTDSVAPATSEDDTELGVGQIGSLGLASLTFNITIPAGNNVLVGDIIYMGDDSLVAGGRKLGVVVEYSPGIFPTYGILQDEDDRFGLPFGSYPFKIARAIRPETKLVVDSLKDLAGIEGSVFGTGFSKNFFINRLREEGQGEDLVTINYNEAIEFRPFNFDLSLGKSNVDQLAEYTQLTAQLFGQWQRVLVENVTETNPQIGSGVPNLGSFSSITKGSGGASKGIDIKLAPAYPHLNKGRTGQEVQGRNLINTRSLESALTRNGLKSYFQSLNSSKDSIAVEFTVIGSQRVLPYELFQFDSRAPEKYRNKQFRITEVSYDLVNDTCKLKGYQISSVTTPTVDDPRPRIAPPRVPPSYTADPIGVLLRGVDDADVDTLRINFYTSINTGSSIMVLNDLEREQGYFREPDAGQYEVNTAKGDVADTTQGSFIGKSFFNISGNGNTYLEISVVAQAVITLTAGDSLVLHNLAGQTETVVVRTTTVTTIGGESKIPINSVVLNNFYQAELSFVATPSYTTEKVVTTFPTGGSEIPLDGTSRINAPTGSFVYLTSTYEGTGERITKAFTQELNVRLIDTDLGLVATQNSLLTLTSNVSNIDGVVTAQGSFLVSLNSTVSDLDGVVVGQSTAITGLNTRVTAGEGYLISNASAITEIESRIDDPTTGLSASATAIDILKTNVSSIDGTLTATAERIDVIEVNVTTAEGSITAISSDVSNVSIEVDEVTGKVSNISAKRAIVVGAGNKLARIDLSANDGDGSTGSTVIDISADQVKINQITFDEAGAMYSNNFVTTGAPTTNGVITDGVVTREGVDGWAFDRAGKLYADEPFFRNGDYNGGTQVNMTYTDPIIVFPARNDFVAAGGSINALSIDALEVIKIQISVGDGSASANLNGIVPITISGNRVGTKVTIVNSNSSVKPSQLVIVNQSGSATDVNRINATSNADFSLAHGDSAELFYDTSISRWIIIGSSRVL